MAIRTVQIEAAALASLASALRSADLGGNFALAVELIVGVAGHVITTGMGKSGLVARKIAATLASTGTPALFMHSADASHGDLGMVTSNDVVLALSWSGETSELSAIIAYCRRFNVPLIAITSRSQSTLGRCADICLTLPDVQEACPHNLAPTSSTTMQVVLGDALAVAAIDRRKFSPDDFKVFHPKGQLGARLVKLSDLMSDGEALPCVGMEATIAEAALEMSAKRFGITAVVDAGDRLLGAFSDGDLRRSLSVATIDQCVSDHMSKSPLSLASDTLASEALALMNDNSVSQLFVCDGKRLIGVVHLHDILRAGVV